MSAGLKKSLADVLRRRGRTLLVVLGIFIGVLGLTVVNFTEDTIFNAFAFSISGPQPDIVLVVDHLDASLLPALQAVPGVKALQYRTIFLTQWRVTQAPGTAPLVIVSFPDLQHTALVGFQLTGGRYPTAPNEIVMDYGDQAIQSFNLGDPVTVETPSGLVQLRVVGLGRTRGENPTSSGRALAYMTDAGLARLAGVSSAGDTAQQGNTLLQHSILVSITSLSQQQAVVTGLRGILQAHTITVLSTNFPDHADPATLQAINSVFSLLRILIIVAVVMSGLLILNTIATLIAEQTAIIGTMKAMGGTRGKIMRGYLASVVIYSLLGTLPAVALGIAGGYALASWLTSTIPLDVGPFALTPEVIPLGLAVGFGVPMLAALVPLWNGTRITVREALSGYGVNAGQGAGERGRMPAWLPPMMALGLRGAFRKRWRVALTLVTLTVAGICFLVVQTAVTSVNYTIGDVYGRFNADVMAEIPLTSLSQVRAQLSGVANIARIERFAIGGSDTPWGHLELWGFDPDTQLYHYQLTGGRWLQPGDTNVVLLSDDAAAKSGLHIGDTLGVSSRGGSAIWTIIGTVKQPTDNLGGLGSAITTTNTLDKLDGIQASNGPTPPDLAWRIMVQAQDRSPQAVAQLTTDISNTLNVAGPQFTSMGQKADTALVYTVAAEALRHQQQWYILYDLLYAVALVVGAAGMLGLANALVISVLERRREIGMLRSMGATGWRVAQVFWTEGLALGSIAWLLAALLGLPLAYGFVLLLRQAVVWSDFMVDATAFIVMLAAIVGIATLASITPARRAGRLHIAEILRYE